MIVKLEVADAREAYCASDQPPLSARMSCTLAISDLGITRRIEVSIAALRIVGLTLLSSAVSAGEIEPRRNWFGDPYLQVSNDIASCPEPLGPLITESEALRESHHRAERGTRCHLEGRCRHPSSYDYDREIAENIASAARKGRLLPRPSTLWVLVQGRRVWIYGCAATGYQRGRLERGLQKIPDVELAMEEIRVGARGKTPYLAK